MSGFLSSGRYEGSLKDGKPHGEGKEYDENGMLWYEGQFKDGQRHGEGKLYDENGDLLYGGEFQDGKPNMKGIPPL